VSPTVLASAVHHLARSVPESLKMSKVRQFMRVVSSDRPAPRGKIVHDARGNAVWQWQQDAAELDRTTTTGLLRKLSGPVGLSLESESAAVQSGSTDPYNRGPK
jgi:hypothetical protein